jgi:RNA polymerase sigma-70 factor (ECF subfamily)
MDRAATSLTTIERAERAMDADVALQMDEHAFQGFYDRTARPVWAYLQRLSGDAHAADDLLQETYYRFLRADLRLDTESHRRHYLFRIATNLANDRFRRSQARPTEVVHDTDTVGPSAAQPAHDRRIDMTRAMARLSRRERAMLHLAYVQGASHHEIAGVLGLRATSVKTLLFRARRRFAQLLGHRREDG